VDCSGRRSIFARLGGVFGGLHVKPDIQPELTAPLYDSYTEIAGITITKRFQDLDDPANLPSDGCSFMLPPSSISNLEALSAATGGPPGLRRTARVGVRHGVTFEPGMGCRARPGQRAGSRSCITVACCASAGWRPSPHRMASISSYVKLEPPVQSDAR
jgi:hypothetical protein